MKNLFIYFSFLLILLSCASEIQQNNLETNAEMQVLNKAEKIIGEAIIKHGGANYAAANYSFIFRGKQYSFKNNGNKFTYSLNFYENGDSIVDILTNNSFQRRINGEVIALESKAVSAHSNHLNSVIYFATLPHKLNDKAVILEYAGKKIINNKNYSLVSVKFKQDGGGDDFEDEYCYWVNDKNKTIDFLAYNYRVNGGGARFRASYNIRKVGGIIFQDYINYEADFNIELSQLGSYYEKGKLNELSKIELKDIKRINQ